MSNVSHIICQIEQVGKIPCLDNNYFETAELIEIADALAISLGCIEHEIRWRKSRRHENGIRGQR